MNIGVPKETKDQEHRVAVTPDGVRALGKAGHTVLIELNAGTGSGFSDQEYLAAGALLGDAVQAWSNDIVVKVKEPLESEYRYLDRQILFTYLHLSGVAPSLTEVLLERQTTAIAYETVEDEHGRLPLLAPMSAVAGNMAVTVGSYYLAKFNRGRGVQLGMVIGQRHGKVVVIGDGVVGRHAARTADAMGASVVVFGRHQSNRAEVQRSTSADVRYETATPGRIAREIVDADLLVGAILSRGAKATHVVTAKMVATMPAGAVIVDVSIDQGGCVETARPTSHSDPVFIEHGVTHYCVTNMPGAFPRTSTVALTNATLPYLLRLAERGVGALSDDPTFGCGTNTYRGFLTNQAIADALGLPEHFRRLSSFEKLN